MGPILLSVLSVEPYGMKLVEALKTDCKYTLSVLSVEPYGMKYFFLALLLRAGKPFSALGRAVWDETYKLTKELYGFANFQCSRSSRMG